jgi:hypothetical protein
MVVIPHPINQHPLVNTAKEIASWTLSQINEFDLYWFMVRIV